MRCVSPKPADWRARIVEAAQPAPHGRRLVAFGLDSCLGVLLLAPAGATLLHALSADLQQTYQTGNPIERSFGAATWSMVPVLAGAGLLILAAVQVPGIRRRGQTVGKRMMGLRIIKTDGAPVGLWDGVVLRSVVAGTIPWLWLAVWPLGLVLPGHLVAVLVYPLVHLGVAFPVANILRYFVDNRRCYHDELADTGVVATVD